MLHAVVVCLGLLVGVLPRELALAEELQAELLAAWEFQRSDDRNADQWPDQWRRRSDRLHPGYIPVKIAPCDATYQQAVTKAQLSVSRCWLAFESGQWKSPRNIESIPKVVEDFFDRWVLNNCLEVTMDGGAVELDSPIVPLDPQYSYYLDSKISTDALDGHRAWIGLELLDDQQKTIHTLFSPQLTGTTAWTHASTASSNSEAAGLRYGRIKLKIEPLESVQLSGTAKFDSIRLYRMPKLTLTTNAAFNVTQPGKPIEVACEALGVHRANSAVHFQLYDHVGNKLDETSIVMESIALAPAVSERAPPLARQLKERTPTYVSSNSAPKSNGNSTASAHRIDGRANWTLRIDRPGFYRVRVDLGESANKFQQREITVGVVDDRLVESQGPFGLSIADFDSAVSIEQLPKLIHLAGAGWVKIPVWFEANDTKLADQLAWLVERLQTMKVNCVGRLERSHASLKGDNASKNQSAFNQFQSAETWEPLLEPVLTRMSMKLSWFQLGSDDERSFMGRSDLVKLLNDVRGRMQSYSQEEIKLVIAWDWLEPFPGQQAPSWQGSQMAADPPLTANELTSYLKATGAPRHVRWAAIDPLPRDRYSLLDRTRDLTERMVAVKKLAAPAAFITKPFDPQTGIFNPDGSISELLLPWRTLVSSIGDATYLGSMEMPNASPNHIFQRDQEGLMLVWNDKPTSEQLYLGENHSLLDLWGRSISLNTPQSGSSSLEKSIPVNPWPVVVRGIDIPVVFWHKEFELRTKNIDSLLGQKQSLECSVRNSFKQSLQGTVTVVAPSLLQTGASPRQIQLAEGRASKVDIPILLRSDASAGTHSIRFDFDLHADRRYQFSVYRTISLGSGDVEMQWTLHRQSNGRGELRLELANNSEKPVSFDCKLFPPGQPYQRVQIIGANPGRTSRQFSLNLKDVAIDGIVWLHCEEIGTVRVLNYRIPVNP